MTRFTMSLSVITPVPCLMVGVVDGDAESDTGTGGTSGKDTQSWYKSRLRFNKHIPIVSFHISLQVFSTVTFIVYVPLSKMLRLRREIFRGHSVSFILSDLFLHSLQVMFALALIHPSLIFPDKEMLVPSVSKQRSGARAV